MTKDQLDRSAYFSNLDVVVPNTYLNHTRYQVVGFFYSLLRIKLLMLLNFLKSDNIYVSVFTFWEFVLT